jgi:hypothetical protein
MSAETERARAEDQNRAMPEQVQPTAPAIVNVLKRLPKIALEGATER